MATDSLKLVRWSSPYWEAQRPVVLANLTIAGQRFIADGQSPQLIPGEHETGNIRLDAPYAGEIDTLNRHGNARFTVGLRTLATDPVADVNGLVGAILAAPARSAIEWRRDGTGIPSYFPIRGDAQWTPAYEMRQRQQGAGMTVALSVEVAPYVHHGSMDVYDDFQADSIGDYTVELGAGTLSVTGGQLVPSSTAEKRLYYSDRGHRYGDVQVTVKITPGPSVTNHLALIRVKRLDSTNWIEAGIQQSSGFVGIWKYDGGTRTQLDSGVSVTATASTAYWMRLRVEGNVISAEVFATAPTPMGAPAVVTTHTLSGANATKYGAGVVGDVGARWVPVSTSERLDDLHVKAYTYRNQTLPQTIQLGGPVPGDLPALCDLEITSSGGAAAPISGLFGWVQRPTTPGFGVAPFGILEGEAATLAAGYSTASDAGARGGTVIGTTALGVAWWSVDANTIPPDDDGSLSVEVFARCAYNTSTGFNIQLFADPRLGPTYGARRYGDRGAAGLVPLAGSGVYGMRRLGRIRLSGEMLLGLLTPASPAFVIDYLVLVPSRSFVSSPMGVALDASYPKFAPSTSETTRILLSDGASTIAAAGYLPMLEHGLGRRIEIPPGNVDLVGKLSTVVIDRPETDATIDQLAHPATVHARVLPRFAFA